MIRKNTRRFDPRYFMDEKTEKKVLKEAPTKYTELPEEPKNPDLFQYADEQRRGEEMDQISKELEKEFMEWMLQKLYVPDTDGKMMDLDQFISKMGNYVATEGNDIDLKRAKTIIQEITSLLLLPHNRGRPGGLDYDPSYDLAYVERPDPYDDPGFPLQEMKRTPAVQTEND